MRSLWRKIKTYKMALQLFVSLNLFVVFLGLFFLLDGRGSLFSISEKPRISPLIKVHQQILQVSSTSSDKDIFGLNYELTNLKISRLPTDLPLSKKQYIENKRHLLQVLEEEISHQESILLNAQADQKLLQNRVMLSAVLSLLFGFVIPALLVRLLWSAAKKIKQEGEERAKSFALQWVEEKSKHSNAFQSPEFWMRIAFLSIRHWGPYVDHPMADYIVDITQELERESLKSSSSEREKAA